MFYLLNVCNLVHNWTWLSKRNPWLEEQVNNQNTQYLPNASFMEHGSKTFDSKYRRKEPYWRIMDSWRASNATYNFLFFETMLLYEEKWQDIYLHNQDLSHHKNTIKNFSLKWHKNWPKCWIWTRRHCISLRNGGRRPWSRVVPVCSLSHENNPNKEEWRDEQFNLQTFSGHFSSNWIPSVVFNETFVVRVQFQCSLRVVFVLFRCLGPGKSVERGKQVLFSFLIS